MPLLTASVGPRHQTKQEFVYQTLRAAILACELKPGERLIIDELARRLGVSIIPVREALQMLQADGLVVNVPHVGAAVAPISRESIVDVFTVLEGLELVSTRLVAEQGPPAALDALVRSMDECAASGRFERWADLNTRFHQTISASTGLPLLAEMMDRVLGRWDRLRRYYFSGVLSHRVRVAQQEHRDILAALQSRDFPALEAHVRTHNRGALAAYMQYLNQSGAES
jgi:DNA-binding GntR family transcriptional regulator